MPARLGGGGDTQGKRNWPFIPNPSLSLCYNTWGRWHSCHSPWMLELECISSVTPTDFSNKKVRHHKGRSGLFAKIRKYLWQKLCEFHYLFYTWAPFRNIWKQCTCCCCISVNIKPTKLFFLRIQLMHWWNTKDTRIWMRSLHSKGKIASRCRWIYSPRSH